MNPLVSSGHLRNEKERKTSGTVTGDRRGGGGGGGVGGGKGPLAVRRIPI